MTSSTSSSAAICLFLAVSMLIVSTTMADKMTADNSYDVEAPISAFKRFYSWEDTKRAASSEEGLRNKRKQFYAWAGKRSSAPVHYFEDSLAAAAPSPSMEKRKQFYAWAGK